MIHNRNVVRVSTGTLEDYTPLIVDPNRIETCQLSAQLLQAIGGRNGKIFQARRRVDRFQLPFGPRRKALKFPNGMVTE
jgi:hypothetical protein